MQQGCSFQKLYTSQHSQNATYDWYRGRGSHIFWFSFLPFLLFFFFDLVFPFLLFLPKKQTCHRRSLCSTASRLLLSVIPSEALRVRSLSVISLRALRVRSLSCIMTVHNILNRDCCLLHLRLMSYVIVVGLDSLRINNTYRLGFVKD